MEILLIFCAALWLASEMALISKTWIKNGRHH